MTQMLTPYLNFAGQAAEAMKFYHSILGGELKMQTFGEAKMAQSPEEEKLIIHANLVGEGFTLMASDTHPSMKSVVGNNVRLSLSDADGERLTKAFNALAEGGKVDFPLAKQFWGDTFGEVTDKYGMHWMVNILTPK